MTASVCMGNATRAMWFSSEFERRPRYHAAREREADDLRSWWFLRRREPLPQALLEEVMVTRWFGADGEGEKRRDRPSAAAGVSGTDGLKTCARVFKGRQREAFVPAGAGRTVPLKTARVTSSIFRPENGRLPYRAS